MENFKLNVIYALGLFPILAFIPVIGYLLAGILIVAYAAGLLFSTLPARKIVSVRIAQTYAATSTLYMDMTAMLSHVVIMVCFGFYVMALMQFVVHVLSLAFYQQTVRMVKISQQASQRAYAVLDIVDK